jgi:hypothetical protein
MSESIILTGASYEEKSNKLRARKLIDELIEIRIQEDVEQLTDLTASYTSGFSLPYTQKRFSPRILIIIPCSSTSSGPIGGYSVSPESVGFGWSSMPRIIRLAVREVM